MELTGDLKDKVDKTKSLEEAREFIEEAGMKLTDEELENVAGGSIIHLPDSSTSHKHPWENN